MFELIFETQSSHQRMLFGLDSSGVEITFQLGNPKIKKHLLEKISQITTQEKLSI